MDINLSQMESQDIIKVVLIQRTTCTNVSLRVIVFQLICIVWKEKNIEKLIITIMMIVSLNNQTATREDMLRVWHVSLLEFRKFEHQNKYFTNGKLISTVSQLPQNKQE